MSSYDFIVDNIRFSYSSVSTCETCAHSFRLSYIDACLRKNNFYSDFGTLVHEVFERFFKGETEMSELSDYYRNNYSKIVKSDPPPIPVGLGDKYKEQGQFFFDFFFFEKDKYNVLFVEDKIDLMLDGFMFTGRPDLVLQNKETGETTLFDYKTSTPFRIDKRNGKEIADRKKLNGYYKQMYTYTFALKKERNISVDKISLWFPRLDRIETIEWKHEDEVASVNWLSDTIKAIKNEEVFPYNNEGKYFCDNLCGVRDFCEYR